MDSERLVTNVVSVIEPDINQLLGSYILYLSLRSHPALVDYHLVLVDRSAKVASQMVRWARDRGLRCESRPPRSDNPYFNRWLFLDAFESLRAAPHVVLLDWDITYIPDARLPDAVDGSVRGRLNPPWLYQRHVRALRGTLPPGVVSDGGDLSSSVNSGVLISSGAALARVAERSNAWAGQILRDGPPIEPWAREQLITSIAVGEVGLSPLDERWNVTPLSPVDDAATCLWHYNDSTHATRRLKRNLVRPKLVEEICRELSGRWPRTIACFQELYEEASRTEPFRAFLR
jgi:hypothetical protein